MPGIFGFVKDGTKEVMLDSMIGKLFYQEYFLKDKDFIDEYLEASHIHLGNMKKDTNLFYKNGVYISIEGEQYSYIDDSFEDLIFNAYNSNELYNFLNKLDGYFHAVIYDQNIEKVYLISDRYGMRMLYYYFNNGRFAYSGEVKGLLGLDFVDRSIDNNQINCFIDLGFLVEDKTFYKYIKLVKPASIIEFDIISKKLTQEYYWKWSQIKQQRLSFNTTVDMVGEIFINAVKKRFEPNNNVGIALSGGLDSRAIFAAVNKVYPTYDGYAYTFGIQNCDDIEIAKRCIEKTSWKHGTFHFEINNWFNPRKRRVMLTDGMLNIMHMHGVEFLDSIKERINFNLNGYSGDIVLGGGWFNKLPLNTRANRSNLGIFYGQYAQFCDITDDFYNIPHIEPHLFMNRVRRFTNMGTVNALDKVDQRKPFFDNDLIELIYSIPDDYRKDNKLYGTMLMKYFPEFYKDIPWQKTGNIVNSFYSDSLYTKLKLKLKKIYSRFINNNQSTVDYKNWIKQQPISEYLLELLDINNAFYTRFIQDDIKKQYLIPHLNNKNDFSEMILRASTIELYFNNFE